MFLKILSQGILFIFLVGFMGCTVLEYNVGTHKKDLILYSTDKEIRLGRNLAKKVGQEYPLSKNPIDLKRVNDIGDKIAEVCDRQEVNYYFYVIDKLDKNAFSLPGGYVYVNKGLLDILDDDELAFVIAHEIGHIVARHHIKKLQAAMGYNLLLIASTQTHSRDFTRGLAFALAQIFVAYSRKDEFLADELAVKYTKLAGFDPQAGIRVMEKLYQAMKKAPLREISYFRTHPHIAARIRHIKEVSGIPLDINDYINE